MPRRDAQNRVVEWFGTSTDIDDRKRAAEALREREEWFRRIVETSAEGIWVIDAESRTTYVNRRMTEMLGSTVQDMLGRCPNDFLFAEDLEAARTLFRLKRQGDDRPFDFRLRRTDGAAIWCSIANRPLYAQGGQFLGVLGMFSDVTDRRRLEESLREADRLKDEFLASLAHELRNLLAPIRSAANLLQAKGSTDPTLERARGVIERQVEQMARLVGDLLDVARITRNKLELRPEQIDVAAVVHSAIEISRPLIEANRHTLTVTLPPEPLYVNADQSRLAQALANVLNNAAKFTEKGGHIGLTSERQAGDVVIRIKDNGIGIAAEELARIFEMFTQGETSSGQSQGGLGIGLTLVRRLVEMHGGTIEAHSEGPGKGSEFIMRLPIMGQAGGLPGPMAGRRPAPRPTDSEPPGRGAKRRILIADDEEDMVVFWSELLAMRGYEIRTAYDGLRAIEEAVTFQPDVALLDLQMPKLDGYGAARRIREQPWGKRVVLIALSGLDREEERRRTREAGFDHLLVKPVGWTDLEHVLTSSAHDPEGRSEPR